MTREALLVWWGFVLLTISVGVCIKGYLLYKAAVSRRIAISSGKKASSPERIVADETLLDTSFGILLALASTGIGLLFVTLIVNAPPPPNLDRTYDISQSSLILLLLLTVISVDVTLRAIARVINLQRLINAMEEIQLPPAACSETTFEGCPFISPERLGEIRAMAESIADQAHDISTELDQIGT